MTTTPEPPVMPKARVVPLAFGDGPDDGFHSQCAAIRRLLGDRIELLPPAVLGGPLPACDAVILPQVTFGIAVRMAVMAMLGGN